MMTTKEPTATYKTASPATDVIFLQELENILPEPFDARIFPGHAGRVKKALVTTKEEVQATAIEGIIKLAAIWKLHLSMALKNGIITIKFSNE